MATIIRTKNESKITRLKSESPYLENYLFEIFMVIGLRVNLTPKFKAEVLLYFQDIKLSCQQILVTGLNKKNGDGEASAYRISSAAARRVRRRLER